MTPHTTPRTSPERDVQTAILHYLATRDDLRAWRANAGAAVNQAGRVVRFGVRGQSDISGILRGGIRLEIEVKSPTGRLSEDQINFGAMITRFGGVFVVARSVADVETALAPFLTPAGGPP